MGGRWAPGLDMCLSSGVKFKLCSHSDTPRTKLVVKAELCKELRSPVVKEDLSVCTCAGRLLEGQKGRGPHPIISMNMHPQASVVGSILEKVAHASWGGFKDQSGVKKEAR